MTPRLKKPSLSASDFNNFRPISNLSTINKVLEKAVVLQLQEYLENHKLHAPSQSAYRQFHSVETATLRVHNDIMQALDQQKEVIIVLIDFSSAFDTIEHMTLTSRVSHQFGISGTVLNWIKSYLTDRSHSVSVLNSASRIIQDGCGVPQGSVIGPLLFILYTAPIHHIIKSHGLEDMMYADDVQIYLSFDPCDRDTAISRINACVSDIRSWSTRNMLALNESKTEVLHLHSKFVKYPVPSITVTVGESQISPSPEIRNLGAMMDTHMTMRSHVKKTCQLAMAAASNIGRIRRYLDKSPPSSSHMHLSHLVWTISTHYLVTFPKRTHPGFREIRTSQHASLHASVAQHQHHLYCKIYTGSRLTSESSLKYFSSHTRLCTDLHPCIFLNFSKGINNVAPFVRKVTFFFKFLLLAHSTMAPGLLPSLHPHYGMLCHYNWKPNQPLTPSRKHYNITFSPPNRL